MYFLPVLALMAATSVRADVGIRYGLGVLNSAKSSPTEVKIIGLNYTEKLGKSFFVKTEVGYFIDSSGSSSRKSSAYGNTSLGIEVSPSFLLLRGSHGLAVISTPDSYLGRRFPQFSTDLFFGLKDNTGSAIGISYKHISSAGLVMPNQGRDFITLEYSIKL